MWKIHNIISIYQPCCFTNSMNLWTAGSWYLPRIYPIYTVCENDSFDTSGRIHISSRYIVSTSATSAMPKPCATSEAIPFSSGDSHIKFGDTSCFLKKLLVYFPSPECLAYPRTGQSAKSVADQSFFMAQGMDCRKDGNDLLLYNRNKLYVWLTCRV